jgi:hypothetical protein
MAKITITAGSKQIAPDARVWILHPGRGYRFYEEYAARKKVWMEFPGVELPNTFELNQDIVRRLRMGKAISDWYDRGQVGQAPSRDPDSYRLAAGKYLHEAVGLYVTAKASDLILVPGKGYHEPVLVGELGERSRPARSARYPDELIPARSVTWLKEELTKWDFSHDLFMRMHRKPQAFAMLAKHLEEEVFDYAYDGNWIIEGEIGSSRLTVNPVDDQADFNAIGRSLEVICYYAAMAKAIDDDQAAEFFQLGMRAAIDQFYDADVLGGEISVHSPGELLNRAKRTSVALFVSAMISMTGADLAFGEPHEIVIDNSWEPTELDCEVEVESYIRGLLDMMMLETYREVCEAHRIAAAKAGLSSSVQVEIDDKG